MRELFERRTVMLMSLVGLVIFCLVALLYWNQILNYVDPDTSTDLNTITTTETVEAARGIITDRYGQELVGNSTQYNIELNFSSVDEKEQGRTVLTLLRLMGEMGLSWADSELPISSTAPYAFTTEDIYYTTGSDGGLTKTRLLQLCNAMEWSRTDDAQKLLNQMAGTWGLSGEDGVTIRAACGILYSAALRSQEIVWTNYYLVENVTTEQIAQIQEYNLEGVKITAVSTRQYATTYAAHLLGTVGYFTAEEWKVGSKEYLAAGYEMDDIIGKSGVEAAFEDYLRGTDGTLITITDTDGNIISQEYETEPQAGDTVALTIDLDLQTVVEDALAKYVPDINNSEGGAAAVVLNVADSSVLAMASYPTYDPTDNSYDAAAADFQPFFNRALQGTYAPGSTYKMVTALAGLQEGIITPATQILDTGKYTYYSDYQPACWLWNSSRSTHGYETVSDAIRDSCNVFFYDVGRQVGITKLTEYAQALGLGVSSGIELYEATGINAGPAYSESQGQNWYDGSTLAAAIGQSDNLFTPLQISNYLATLLKGGTRHAAHLLSAVYAASSSVKLGSQWEFTLPQLSWCGYFGEDSIFSAGVETEVGGNLLDTYEPEVLNTVDIDSQNLDAIKEGMAEVVTSTSTVAAAFSTLEAKGIKVGAKTGSAQVSGQESANGLFVCFAPYDDPEIVICVAVEKGGSGAATSTIAAAIMEYYYSGEAAAKRASLS